MPLFPAGLLQPLRSRSTNNVEVTANTANDHVRDAEPAGGRRGSATGGGSGVLEPPSRSYAGLVVPGITVNDDAGNTAKEEARRMSGGDAGEVSSPLLITDSSVSHLNPAKRNRRTKSSPRLTQTTSHPTVGTTTVGSGAVATSGVNVSSSHLVTPPTHLHPHPHPHPTASTSTPLLPTIANHVTHGAHASHNAPPAVPLALPARPMFLAKAPPMSSSSKPGRSTSSLPLAMTLGGGAGGPGGSGPSTPGTVTVGMATMDDPNSNLILPSSYMRAVASGEVMGGAGAVTGGRKVDTGKTTRKRAKQVIDARYHGDSLASPPVISVGRSTATGTGMTEAERYRAMIRAQQDGDGARGDGDVGAPKKKKKKRRKEVVVETTGGESSRPAQTQTQAQAAVAATEAVTVASREQEGGREGDRTRARRATRRRTGSGRRDDGVDGRLGLARNASMMRRNLWDEIPEVESPDGASGSLQPPGAEPPPPFPYPTPSTVRLPPAFGSVVGSSTDGAGGERRSPPPSFEVAMTLGIIAGAPPVRRSTAGTTLPVVREAAEVSTSPQPQGDEPSDEEPPSLPSEPPSPSEIARRWSSMTPAERKVQHERDAWLADLTAGLDLEERVRRDLERKRRAELEGKEVPGLEGSRDPHQQEDREIPKDAVSAIVRADSLRWSRQQKGKGKEVFVDVPETRSGLQTPLLEGSTAETELPQTAKPNGRLARKLSVRTEASTSDVDLPGAFPGTQGRRSSHKEPPTILETKVVPSRPRPLSAPQSIGPFLAPPTSTTDLSSVGGPISEGHTPDVPAKPAQSAIDTTVSEADSASRGVSRHGSEITLEADLSSKRNSKAPSLEAPTPPGSDQAHSPVEPLAEQAQSPIERHDGPELTLLSPRSTVPPTAVDAMRLASVNKVEDETEVTIAPSSAKQVQEKLRAVQAPAATSKKRTTSAAELHLQAKDASVASENAAKVPESQQVRSPRLSDSPAVRDAEEGPQDSQVPPTQTCLETTETPREALVFQPIRKPAITASPLSGPPIAAELHAELPQRKEGEVGVAPTAASPVETPPAQSSPIRPLFPARTPSSTAIRNNPWSTSRVKQLLGDAVDRIERGRYGDASPPSRMQSTSDSNLLPSPVESPRVQASPSPLPAVPGTPSAHMTSLPHDQAAPEAELSAKKSVSHAEEASGTLAPNRLAALARRDLLASRPPPAPPPVDTTVYRHPFNRSTRPNFRQPSSFSIPLGSPVIPSPASPAHGPSPNSPVKALSGASRSPHDDSSEGRGETPQGEATIADIQPARERLVSVDSNAQPTTGQMAVPSNLPPQASKGSTPPVPRRPPPPIPAAKRKHSTGKTPADDDRPTQGIFGVRPFSKRRESSPPGLDSGRTESESSDSETWTEDETEESSSNYSTSEAAPETPAPYRFYPPKGVPRDVLRPDGYRRNLLESELIARVKPKGPRERRPPPPLPPRPTVPPIKTPVPPSAAAKHSPPPPPPTPAGHISPSATIPTRRLSDQALKRTSPGTSRKPVQDKAATQPVRVERSRRQELPTLDQHARPISSDSIHIASPKNIEDVKRDASPWQAGPSHAQPFTRQSFPMLNEVKSKEAQPPDDVVLPALTGTGPAVRPDQVAKMTWRRPSGDRVPTPAQLPSAPPVLVESVPVAALHKPTPPPVAGRRHTPPTSGAVPKRKKVPSPAEPAQPPAHLKIPSRMDDRPEVEMRSRLIMRVNKWRQETVPGDPDSGKRTTKFPKIVPVPDAPPMVDIVGPSASVVGIAPTVLPAFANAATVRTVAPRAAPAPAPVKIPAPVQPPAPPPPATTRQSATDNADVNAHENANAQAEANPNPVTGVNAVTTINSRPPPLTQYTDVDVLVDRLAGTGREYEGLAEIEDFLGPEIPRGASPDRLANLLIGRVEVESRRVAASGKVKLKLSALGIRVVSCPVCLRNYKEGEFIALLPNCGHVSHQQCATKWLSVDSRCMVCREPL